MKAERRHELKTNALARGLEGLPQYAQLYGNRALLVVIAILALILIVRYRMESNRQATARAREEVEIARREVDRLRDVEFWRLGSPENVADFRNEAAQKANDAIKQAQALSDDPAIRAQAYLVQGDLDWRLANFPELPGATTRPDQLGLPRLGSPSAMTRDDYLKQSESAYGEVLRLAPPGDHLAMTTARFSLAAIAENRRDWDGATRFYQEIINDPQASKGLKDFAQQRIKELDDLRQPPLLAQNTTQPAVPATLPEMSGVPFGPVPLPATLPSASTASSSPAAPTTVPELPPMPATLPTPVPATNP